MENTYTELAVRLENVDQRAKSNEHRIVALEGDMSKLHDTQLTLVKLANGVDKMGEQLMEMKNDVRDIKDGYSTLNNRIVEIEHAPAERTQKRLDAIWEKVMWLAIGGLAAYVLSQIIPTIPW